MKRTVLFTLALSIALLASLFVGIATSYQHTQQYVSYRFDAVLINPVANVTGTPPFLVINGYRPAAGIVSANITIDGVMYTYPKDFNYSETFHVETNMLTNKSVYVVTSTYTFNMQGNPTITEWLTMQVTNIQNVTTTDDSVFYLTGTGKFCDVGGGGFVVSTGNATIHADYAKHIGLIKGWPM
jgi:hypothetical protein